MSGLRIRLLAPIAAAVLAGCSFIPTYERPAAPVATAFPYPSATEGAPARSLDWQRFFTDERLRGLIGTALSSNRDLRVAVLNIEQARAQYDIRRADRYPTVGAGVNASRAPNPVTGDQVSSFQAGLAFTAWEIDFFGRIASLSQAALAQYLATEEGRKAAQIALVGSVANAWLALVADEELLALTQQTLATRQESLRLVKLRFDNGVSSELDLRLAQSLAETARAALAQGQRQRAADLNALALLVGQPLPPDFQTGTTMAAITLPDVPAGVPSDVLVSRPDVRQAEQLLVAANANIGAARAAFFPRITLTAQAGRASNQLSGLFDGGGSWAYTIAPSLLLPIFDAGRNQAGLASANVSRDIAVAQYERAIQTAFREVSDALAGRATLTEQLEAQTNVAQAETIRAKLSQMRFDAGVASTLDLLDAQRSLFTAQQAEIQTRLARLQNQVLLYRALGGGWTESAASP
ncbi:efflux transporter outer membrane subunit [Ramlibacter henchirensis]|uniref:Efflux transporter outer membrane subunit n=1 Tax=Ramlibacter henchirensis TaxID=204072 RepID=A0A4Z0C6Q4_9BURK|nr:efflux transporter outer membrane subunit [Ramlibacter henchirensis]TFZ06058.1 efflux transporter outer membrane subunit [Ramlibacter henchirensis]